MEEIKDPDGQKSRTSNREGTELTLALWLFIS